MPDLSIVEVPHPMATLSPSQVSEVADSVFDAIIEGLTGTDSAKP